MAIITNRPLGAGFGPGRFIAALAGHLQSWNDARVTRKALSRLSDHELFDLGLTRGDIDDIADRV